MISPGFFRYDWREYFSAVFKTKFRWILIHDFLFNAASNLLHVFLPLYILQELGLPLWIALSPILMAMISYAVLGFWGYKIQRVIGTRNFFIIHIVLSLVHNIFLFLLPFHPWALWVYLGFSPLTGLFSVWQPYQIYLAKYTDSSLRGRQLSSLAIIVLLAAAIGAFLGGSILTYGGLITLVAVKFTLEALRLVPIWFLGNIHGPNLKDGFFQTVRLAFSKKFRKTLLSQAVNGFLSTGTLLWPIFIFMSLRTYLSVGSILSISMILQILFAIVVGNSTDKYGRKRVLSTGIIFYSLAWVGRFAIYFLPRSVLLFLGLEMYASFSAQMVSIPFDSSVYDKIDHRLDYRPLYDIMSHVGEVGSMLAVVALMAVLPFLQSYLFVYFLACSIVIFFLPLILNNET